MNPPSRHLLMPCSLSLGKARGGEPLAITAAAHERALEGRNLKIE